MGLKGEGGTLFLGTIRVGPVKTWHLYPDLQGRTIRLECTGSFARFWVSRGAAVATVRTAPRQSSPRPITMIYTGDVETFTAGRLLLRNVKQERAE